MMRAWAIGSTDPGLFGFVLVFIFCVKFGLMVFKLFDLLERRFEPLLFVEQCALTRRRHSRAQFFDISLAQRRHLLARPFEMGLQSRLAPKALVGGRRLDLGAIMHHALERDQPLMQRAPPALAQTTHRGSLGAPPGSRPRCGSSPPPSRSATDKPDDTHTIERSLRAELTASP